jgi:hypothetical protein
MTNHNGLTDLYLMTEVLAKARTTEPLAEAPRTAKRIAMLSRRKHARQLGNR